MRTSLLSDKEKEILNGFGLAELTASHTYLYLSNRMKTLGLFGTAKYFKSESDDERTHYEKLAEFVDGMGCELSVESLNKIELKVESIEDALKEAFKMESELLMSYEKAVESNEVSTKVAIFLQDFINIQIKSVGEFNDLIARAALCTDILIFDQELANK